MHMLNSGDIVQINIVSTQPNRSRVEPPTALFCLSLDELVMPNQFMPN